MGAYITVPTVAGLGGRAGGLSVSGAAVVAIDGEDGWYLSRFGNPIRAGWGKRNGPGGGWVADTRSVPFSVVSTVAPGMRNERMH